MYTGCAVRPEYFDDQVYKNVIGWYFDYVVPEDDMQLRKIRPTSTTFDFTKLDKIVNSAIALGKQVRGHALVFDEGTPSWLQNMQTKAQAINQMTLHISTIAQRYRGKIRSYDVVNEFIHDFPENGVALRPTIWQRLIGNDYIERALRLARQHDPDAHLIISDFDLEFAGAHYDARRATMLNIVRDLVNRGVPLNGIGLQGHLYDDKAIDQGALTGFIGEIHSLGLDVMVTELDIMDQTLPADVEIRDQVAAFKAFKFLSAIGQGGGFMGLLTWGVADQDSWLNYHRPRPDGLPSRPLALDRSFQPKPLMTVVQHFRLHTEWVPN